MKPFALRSHNERSFSRQIDAELRFVAGKVELDRRVGRRRCYKTAWSKVDFIIPLVIACLSAGCASHPITVGERREVDSARIVNAKLLSPSKERTARLIVTRDAGYVGSATGIDVFVDGERVARLA